MKTIPPNPKRLNELRKEKSMVLIKPDAVARHLVGEILQRFERKGFRIAAMKLVLPTRKQAEKHYTDSEDWLTGSGQRTYDGYIEKGLKPPMKPRDLGLNTRRRLIESLLVGPLVALVLEGPHVIEVVRKMRGATSPQLADVGTIGFDYSLESYELADSGDWAIKNIIHASDSPENAKVEIANWFSKSELFEYKTAAEDVLYSKNWHDKK
ncbi:nucleoside-diphosphate kinase [Candidatus Saccharibacteria bacterium]|nr:nucleoside-diphosphate kinase [Candidatus Saccharibacteria bacterium]